MIKITLINYHVANETRANKDNTTCESLFWYYLWSLSRAVAHLVKSLTRYYHESS